MCSNQQHHPHTIVCRLPHSANSYDSPANGVVGGVPQCSCCMATSPLQCKPPAAVRFHPTTHCTAAPPVVVSLHAPPPLPVQLPPQSTSPTAQQQCSTQPPAPTLKRICFAADPGGLLQRCGLYLCTRVRVGAAVEAAGGTSVDSVDARNPPPVSVSAPPLQVLARPSVLRTSAQETVSVPQTPGRIWTGYQDGGI
uniref:Uncharacterized protein n=1 Tax=Lygus hesperus TaxID=30085 RepID=A0A0A9YLV9_LYGHE